MHSPVVKEKKRKLTPIFDTNMNKIIGSSFVLCCSWQLSTWYNMRCYAFLLRGGLGRRDSLCERDTTKSKDTREEEHLWEPIM